MLDLENKSSTILKVLLECNYRILRYELNEEVRSLVNKEIQLIEIILNERGSK